LDIVGSTWKLRQGDDPQGTQRSALRALLGEYLGLAPCREEQARAAAPLYREEDWMLTRLAPRSGMREYY
jgi:hypothetical protein